MRALLCIPPSLNSLISDPRTAPAYLDGYSTFYVNSDNKIYQHSLDRVRPDQEKNVNKSVIQRLLELVGKEARVAQPV